VPRDAEAWLAERGIERDPIRVDPAPAQPREAARSSSGDATAAPGAADPASVAPGAAADVGGAPLTSREAGRLADQAAADATLADAERRAHPDTTQPRLEDDVAEAVAYIRRSTSSAPQAEGRLRDKLADRGWPHVVVDQALERARSERLVDDQAMASALVAERRAKGHAPARIRQDLTARGFTAEVLEPLLDAAQREDPEAAAFDLAARKAATLTGESTETAFRRTAAHVARRGYPDGLARKVAREAVFSTRDPERTAGH